MARHISDLRLVLDVMSRPDPGGPCWTPSLRLGDKMPDPIRVAVTIDPMGAGCHPSAAAGVRWAATIHSDAGDAIKETDPPRVADPPIIECLSNFEIKQLSQFHDVVPEGHKKIIKILINYFTVLICFLTSKNSSHIECYLWEGGSYTDRRCFLGGFISQSSQAILF